MDIPSLESRIHSYRGSREGDTLQQSDPRMKLMAVTKQYAINMSTFNRKNTYLCQKSDGRIIVVDIRPPLAAQQLTETQAPLLFSSS
jgi:hypothetical protein